MEIIIYSLHDSNETQNVGIVLKSSNPNQAKGLGEFKSNGECSDNTSYSEVIQSETFIRQQSKTILFFLLL